MKRSAPFRRGNAQLRRRACIRAMNPERRTRLRAEQYGGEYADWIRSLPCVVPGCTRTDIQACHAKSRGAGGKAEHQFPACTKHHRGQHQIGLRSFEAEYGLDLMKYAANLWTVYHQDRS